MRVIDCEQGTQEWIDTITDSLIVQRATTEAA